MADNAESQEVINTESSFVWGAAEIGRVINRNTRQTNYLLERGAIKAARKKGGRWVAERSALIREMTA
jgi:hypothetical protein